MSVNLDGETPVGLDFLETITNVSWAAGNWMAFLVISNPNFEGGPNPDISATVTATFPEISGGTPGFVMVNHHAPLAPASPMPHAITAADLKRKAGSLGGAALIGFGVFTVKTVIEIPPPHGVFHTVVSNQFLKCSGVLATKFRARLLCQRPEANMTVNLGVALYKNVLKPDVVVDSGERLGGTSSPAPSAALIKFFSLPGTDTLDFIVDPQKLTIALG